MPDKRRIKSPQQLWESLSSVLVHFVEGVFFRLGVLVAGHPWRTIILVWIFVIMSCVGLLKFHLEKSPLKLWVPEDSDFRRDTDWYIDTFGTGFRFQKILLVADNVLDPQNLLALHNITNDIRAIEVEYENEKLTIQDLCYRIPIVKFYGTSNVSEDDFTDPTLWVDDNFYCSFLEKFPVACLEYNLLDLWDNNPEIISSSTSSDIVSKINKVKVNPVTGHNVDYSKLLGGIKTDDNGDIVSASSLLITFYTQVNMSAADLNEVGNLVGTEDWVSIPLAMWETKFLELMETACVRFTNMSVYYEAGRSFGDVSGQAMFRELDKLFMGIALMFLYIIFAMSRWNWLEIKLTLSSVGLLCVGMAYATAISWCSLLGIPFGPVHSSLPFLLMGLGIDDMFVMNACWNNLSVEESKNSLPVRVGLMLKHAGVSIVITSFTDIVALLIGAITILPSLKSFCIYAAVGVLFIFCYSVTFYVAVFTLDCKRINSNRNGVIFCLKHKNKITVSKEKTVFQKMLAKFYKSVVFTVPGKSIVIIVTLIMTGFSIEGITHLEQRFDPKWFIPDDTYYKHFINHYEYFYPDDGHLAMVFLGTMDYNTEFTQLYNMTQDLREEPYIKDFVTWIEVFRGYVLKNFNLDVTNTSMVPYTKFKTYLSKFLFSPIGGRFVLNLKFVDELRCGQPASDIAASTLSFKFKRFPGPEEYIPAMNKVKSIVKSANISTGDGYRSVWSKVFANWVTDEIIALEVERNIELALLCVMICTIILITNLQMCFWIFVCVLLTIVNVLGWMQRWGMTVDIVCCIGLELAIGLCVDYAAHVGHTFLTIKEGSRSERAFKTVTSIGSAVLLGGGSTFLSLSILSMSKAYTFQLFFKIFLLVILFGLFNGLVFLPVVLSLIGPDAYKEKEKTVTEDEIVELNGKQNNPEKHIEDS